MKINPETLMAYADGELDAASRAAVAQAVADDPALAAQVAAHQALRQRLAAAFAADLSEPVPERLRQALKPPATAQVVDLAARRAAQAAPAPLDHGRSAAHLGQSAWGWRAWGGLAAMLVAQGVSEIIKKIAVIAGLIDDPNPTLTAKEAAELEVAALVKEIQK